ncbi:MAG: L,D-transpeptidase [Gemmatimonadetes bacterium]|nr:L,D-transpeptidase [Gemmatimonadota bacterium]
MMRFVSLASVLLLPVVFAACSGDGDEDAVAERAAAGSQAVDTVAVATTARQPAAPVQQPPQAPPEMRLEVNLAARELYVYRKEERVATYPVAVGSSEWPTPTGEWSIGQVIWNPRWIPPQEEWAEDEEVSEPGDPDNPLGRAQLVYRAPNSVHGTNEPASLGKAVSHGSIRVSNEVATKLAREVMEAGGAGKDEAWYRSARENRKERQDVNIPNPIPIRVVAGSE